MAETHRYRTDNGTLLTGVSLPDYAALEKQRDDCQQEITNCRKIMEKQGIAIAALEAERGEWKRRTYRIVGHIEEADSIDLHAILAIAEGRDNG